MCGIADLEFFEIAPSLQSRDGLQGLLDFLDLWEKASALPMTSSSGLSASRAARTDARQDSLVSCTGRWCRCPSHRAWGDPSFLACPSAWWGSRPRLQSQTRWRKKDCWPLSRLSPSPHGRWAGNPAEMRAGAAVSRFSNETFLSIIRPDLS